MYLQIHVPRVVKINLGWSKRLFTTPLGADIQDVNLIFHS
jgi:hypothetical protein